MFMNISAQFSTRSVRDLAFSWTLKVIGIVCQKHSPMLIICPVLACKHEGTLNAFYKGPKVHIFAQGGMWDSPTTLSLQEIAIYAMRCLCLSLLLSMWDTKFSPPSSPIAFPLSHIDGGKENST